MERTPQWYRLNWARQPPCRAIYTPADVGAMRGNDPVRQQFICLAEVL
ncbi:MAG: hypothetical protein M5R40_07460 [Anaerolineae bacterium]|nr:hypothetical protein [Anaerolineae bacterium]